MADDNGWQPIETAPKDDGEVLFYHPERGMAVWPASASWNGVTHWRPLPPEPAAQRNIDAGRG